MLSVKAVQRKQERLESAARRQLGRSIYETYDWCNLYEKRLSVLIVSQLRKYVDYHKLNSQLPRILSEDGRYGTCMEVGPLHVHDDVFEQAPQTDTKHFCM